MTRSQYFHLGCFLLLVFISVLIIIVGKTPLTLNAILNGSSIESFIAINFRLPRLFVAAITGATLGLAGSVMQVMLRNPLASPDIIGFGSGAALGAVLTISLTGSLAFITFGALVGGLFTALSVLALAWNKGLSPLAIILVGVAHSVMLIAFTDLIISLNSGVYAQEMLRYLTGSFTNAEWNVISYLSLVLLIGAFFLWWLSFWVNRLNLGDEITKSHGINPDRVRFVGVFVCAILISLSVAFVGPLPFVAFLAGPLARLMIGKDEVFLSLSALVGALIAVSADALARVPIYGHLLPAGLFTSIIGGPAMLFILYTQREK